LLVFNVARKKSGIPDREQLAKVRDFRDSATTPSSGEVNSCFNAVSVDPPSAVVSRLISAALIVHLALIAIAYLSVVRASGLQGRLVDGFAPYLAALHLAPEGNAADGAAAEGTAFYLARGDGAERSYRLQFKSGVSRDATTWRDAVWVDLGGSEGARRFQRFLAGLAGLGETDQNALAARLLLSVVRDEPDADMVRVVRLPNVMTNVVQDAEAAPYTAVIIREAENVRLVRVPQPRLTSASALPSD